MTIARKVLLLLCASFTSAVLLPGTSNAALVGTLQQISPLAASYTEGVDFRVFEILDDGTVSTGDVTASLFAVDLGSVDSGCDAADFAGFTAGAIALIERGGCDFSLKVNNARDAGAVGTLVFDDSQELFPRVGLTDPTDIPALFLTRDLGLTFFNSLLQSGETVVRLAVTEVAQAPEPSILGLFATGLTLLGLGHRKRLARRR